MTNISTCIITNIFAYNSANISRNICMNIFTNNIISSRITARYMCEYLREWSALSLASLARHPLSCFHKRFFGKKKLRFQIFPRNFGDHPFNTYAKFSEKLTFLTPDTHTLFFGKLCVRTKWMNPRNTPENVMVVGWWWQVCWWIVYMKRLNSDSVINLFPGRTKIAGSHYFKVPTSCQQGLDLSTTRQ